MVKTAINVMLSWMCGTQMEFELTSLVFKCAAIKAYGTDSSRRAADLIFFVHLVSKP